MKKERIEEMLQSCLDGYDAGLAPEQCLALFPEYREELEPLFRQALSLRVALAATPAPEFRENTRQRLLFAAGRDVKAAFDAKPDPAFVARAKKRFMDATGAPLQEALRDIPPPRLPFWVNARRRLLEAAQAPHPARPVIPLAFRTGLSAAILVLAVAVAAVAYMTNSGTQPTNASAVEMIERDLEQIESQAAANGTYSTEAYIDLVNNIAALTQQLNEADSDINPDALASVLDRTAQLSLNDGVLTPEEEEAQNQLAQAREKVEEIRQTSAGGQEPTSVAGVAGPSSATATAAPGNTATPGPTSTAVPLGDNQVRISEEPNDSFYQLLWVRIETTNLSLIIPSTWTVASLTLDSNGVGNVVGDRIRIDGDTFAFMFINTATGEIDLILLDGRTVPLVESGGKIIDDSELVNQVGEQTPIFKHMLSSLQLSEELTEAPTPTPEATSTPTSTSTAEPTETPSPTATPDATSEASPTP